MTMLWEHEINGLISQWEARFSENRSNFMYGVALGECIHELKELVTSCREREVKEMADAYYASLTPEELKELSEEWQADEWLSEAHEDIA